MTQYCRYCSNMVCGDANYCTVKEQLFSDEYIKATNKCKEFDLNPIDALGENIKGYHPREHKQEAFDGQLRLEDMQKGE